ncbi:MAG TPA: hypothetical protein DCE41_02750 [Cytophagales bacterium]|nr:hypothetical protein [Cytophagales bacterium]HAA21223.1 hypothetical protein [Cytophagales bacterium]HAP60626.1 hypothetical protein [Cytophagales bacterium]
MSTREAILEEARKQLNENGVANTSAKRVAEALGISDGNLRYHFRTKEDLIWGLYQQLVERFNVKFEVPENTIPSFQQYWEVNLYIFHQLDAYSFLMLDFAAIMRQYPRIHAHYRVLQKGRGEQFNALIEVWQGIGWLRTDLPESQYDQLHMHTNAFADYWVARAYILYEGSPRERIMVHVRSAFAQIVPYLTPSGLAEWQKVDQIKPT